MVRAQEQNISTYVDLVKQLSAAWSAANLESFKERVAPQKLLSYDIGEVYAFLQDVKKITSDENAQKYCYRQAQIAGVMRGHPGLVSIASEYLGEEVSEKMRLQTLLRGWNKGGLENGALRDEYLKLFPEAQVTPIVYIRFEERGVGFGTQETPGSFPIPYSQIDKLRLIGLPSQFVDNIQNAIRDLVEEQLKNGNGGKLPTKEEFEWARDAYVEYKIASRRVEDATRARTLDEVILGAIEDADEIKQGLSPEYKIYAASNGQGKYFLYD